MQRLQFVYVYIIKCFADLLQQFCCLASAAYLVICNRFAVDTFPWHDKRLPGISLSLSSLSVSSVVCQESLPVVFLICLFSCQHVLVSHFSQCFHTHKIGDHLFLLLVISYLSLSLFHNIYFNNSGCWRNFQHSNVNISQASNESFAYLLTIPD